MERDKRKKSKMPCLFGGNGENLNRKILQHRSSPSDGITDHNLFTFEVGQTSSKQGYGTPMKTLLAKEMLNEASAKKRSPSLIAKLMGLDGLPSPQPIHRQQKKLLDNSQNKRNEKLFSHQHKKTTIEQQQFKDVYVDPEASHAGNQCYSSPLNSKRRSTKQDLGYIQERCDEMLRESIAIKSKLERVDSNSDLMLTFLQKPDSLFVKHLHDHQHIPSNSLCNQITVLKPSNSFKREEKETLHYRHRRSSRVLERKDDIALSPTRIVVLKPNLAKIHHDKSSVHVRSPEMYNYKGPLGEVRSSRHKSKEAREIARQITSQMKEGFECGDINLFHSGFRRYDDVDEYDRPRRSPMSQSSMIREAKKRMSQRLKTHGYKDPGMVGRGSFSTLEEMLSVPNSEMRHDDDIINGEYIRSTSRSRSRSVPPSFHNQSHSDLKIVVHSEPVHRIKSKGVKGNFNRREDSRSKNLRYTKRCNACSPEFDDYSPECHSGRRVEQELLVSNIDDPPINSATVDEDSLISQEQWSAKSGVTVSIQLSGPEPESSEGSKEVDQCGQLSLLEASPIEDVSSGSDCFEGVSSRLLELRKQLHLLKMESESTYESQNEEEVEQESSYTVSESENWESTYLTDFLQGSGFYDNDPYTFMTTWYNSVDSPPNPSLFDHLEKKYSEGSTVSRSERRMFYDRISEVLFVISKTRVSCSWVSPRERGIQMTLTEIGFEDQVQKLLGKQEKEAMEDFEETSINKDLDWFHPVDEIDVVGKRIAEMLVNDLVLEIMTV
ncbi:hypothetical protein L2E82_32525 [Cichorium intybus]|uniref:Uncharacterized protein n=1 Tax=Cichorium intybus TaxID=13427 RepID=A0ACB9BI58_CICIN|nr:hypothetical protein L2E82_32525 [Cichorium intybus]